MKALREYIINFGKLKPGKHEYEFAVNDSFFSNFEYSLVKKAKIELHVSVEKQKETLLIFTFEFGGSIVQECDRCLDEFDYPVKIKKQLFVKLGNEEQENDDDLIMLAAEDYEIDISPYIYEFITLDVPMHKSCDMVGKTCNPEMLKRLGQVNEKEKDDDIDPRWAQLKNLTNRDN